MNNNTTPGERARDIMDTIEGILISSLPSQDEPYMPETKRIAEMSADMVLETMDGTLPDPFVYQYWQSVKQHIQQL